MTNIEGLGAIRVVESLLPEILSINSNVSKILIPITGQFEHIAKTYNVECIKKNRILPKAISRAFEIYFPGKNLSGPGPFLILGDMPIRKLKEQVVFVHNPHLVSQQKPSFSLRYFKTLVMQRLFSSNAKYVAEFIVQTDVMKLALCERYNIDAGRVYIIPQPPPEWVVRKEREKCREAEKTRNGLHLFYPARAYPHKNHDVLNSPLASELNSIVDSLVLTIPPRSNPKPDAPWIRCVGELDIPDVMTYYEDCDALVFLSKAESYGLPLIEAMWLGKPIICADLPYARSICADGAIYFDPDSFVSFVRAVESLNSTLARGEIKDWSKERKKIPKSWAKVAQSFVDVCEIAKKNISVGR